MNRLTSGLAAALLAAVVLPLPAVAQTDTTVTAAAAGAFPQGTSFNGVPVAELRFGAVIIISSAGTATGLFQATLLTASDPTRGIEVEGSTGIGSSTAGTATFSGLCSVDMGDGMPPAQDVPFTVTVTSDVSGSTLRLVLGATSLPAAIVASGSVTIE